jgi:lipoprotein-anchoring transpeptidase ErfK/SrfK
MKAASLAAILALALAATGAVAQSPPATSQKSPPATTGESPSATAAPQILNAPKPAQKPAAAEPYAGQKPAGSSPQTTASPAAAQPAATPPPPAAAAAATAPAAEGAAAAAKAAASEAKSAAPVPEGPAVKPIDKGAAPAAATAAKSDAVPALAKPEPPKPTLHVAIDLTSQKMTVTENGGASYKWTISSGRTGYLTPKGTFRPVWMSKMWYSRKYDYAPMPHAIFFHGGAAIHGTDSVYALGRPASHGCVRLSPSNAAALYRMVTKHGKQKTQITVFGTPKQSSAPVASNEDTRRPRTTLRSFEDGPSFDEDDDDMPPFPRRGVYSDRGYDDEYDDRPRYRSPPPRQRRYVRDYDSYDF